MRIPQPATRRVDDLAVKVTPWGPGPEVATAVSRAFLAHPLVRKTLKGARHRLLSFRLVETKADLEKRRIPLPAKDYRGLIFDYRNNRTVLVDGRLGDRKRLVISESSLQPLTSQGEFDEAVKILNGDPEIGRELHEKRLVPYPPMPPLILEELSDGSVERTVAIGLLPTGKEARHEIVGVNMIRRTIRRFETRAPPGSAAHNPICGLPYAGQSTASGVPGQVWVTVSQGGALLWKFLVVRPAASSGTNGSGIELRYVDYRGKRVLYRAHVPILNVKYDNNACGPYRDWQDQEGMIQATGTNVAPGFRFCPAPAQTILESGSDTGNFLGVAIYVQGFEVVLVSEMQAGWYRYISEWRLHADGTIRPRFGFSAVQSSCVCSRHHHHAYWRFDFDIRTAGNNVVREFNDPPIIGSSNWHTKYYEIRRPRDPSRKRKWRIENTVSGEAYELIPSPGDGVATASPDWPFPRGDVWILRYRGTELDDGVVATGPPYEANLDGFLTGEPIYNQDVVVWYATHVTHDLSEEPPGSFGHITGPTLKPVTW